MNVLREADSDRIRASVRGLLPAILSVVVYLGALQVVGQVIPGTSGDLSGFQFLVYGCLIGGVYVGMILVGVYAARTLERPSLRDFGLGIDSQWLGTFAAGVGISLLGILVSWWWGELRGIRALDLAAAGVRSPAEPLVVAAVLAVFTGYFLLGNVYEEVIYRRILIDNFAAGLAARGLSTRAAVGGATIGSLVVFGLLHVVYRGSVLVAVDAALTGTMFAFAYLLTGDLALPIGIHFGRFPTSVLTGESLGTVEILAIGDVTRNTLAANLEVRIVQIGIVCLLAAAWVYRERGSIRIPEAIYS
ncbi:CPBP family intramembrane glutamic endopeptidase [Halorarius halobius]|uniref:CPBP family intramembrane glutamic endopeptidase n=1 Tax=Halorarius halobius TaxID=2962671 RepID=UPI0020CCEAD7|nr:CPBP family intramembrane glutamic endopeptidase [Halorarius halobius]